MSFSRRSKTKAGRIAAVVSFIVLGLAVCIVVGLLAGESLRYLWHKADDYGHGMMVGFLAGLAIRWLISQMRGKQ